MEPLNQILERTYFHNTVQAYLIAFGIIVVGLLLVRIFKQVILSRIRKLTENTDTNLDDYLISSISRFGVPALYFGVLYVGLDYLTISDKGERFIKIATTIVMTFFVHPVPGYHHFAIAEILCKATGKRRGEGEAGRRHYAHYQYHYLGYWLAVHA